MSKYRQSELCSYSSGPSMIFPLLIDIKSFITSGPDHICGENLSRVTVVRARLESTVVRDINLRASALNQSPKVPIKGSDKIVQANKLNLNLHLTNKTDAAFSHNTASMSTKIRLADLNLMQIKSFSLTSSFKYLLTHTINNIP